MISLLRLLRADTPPDTAAAVTYTLAELLTIAGKQLVRLDVALNHLMRRTEPQTPDLNRAHTPTSSSLSNCMRRT